MTTTPIESTVPATAEDLVATLISFPEGTHPSTIYVKDAQGGPVRFTLVENLLTDGSKTYDIVVSPDNRA